MNNWNVVYFLRNPSRTFVVIAVMLAFRVLFLHIGLPTFDTPIHLEFLVFHGPFIYNA